MDWSNYFEYKDGKLFSKVTRGKVKEGDEVGTLDANGYKVFSFKVDGIMCIALYMKCTTVQFRPVWW